VAVAVAGAVEAVEEAAVAVALPVQPPENYAITVTGTSGATTATGTVTLTVQ